MKSYKSIKSIGLASSLILMLLSSCNQQAKQANEPIVTPQKKQYTTYADDVSFMKKYIDIVELTAPNGAGKVAISAALQGRVMTSSSAGEKGRSYGWINRAHFSSKDTSDHINIYGGEERFWLGPEGGQYSIFFKNGDDFNLDNWYTPRLIDLATFDLTESTSSSASFIKKATLTNYTGFEFELGIERKVEVLASKNIENELGISGNTDLRSIAYQTTNTLSNLGTQDWQKKTGLLSIWLLGMYNASPSTTVVIPFTPGTEEALGKPVTDDYFGKVPAERLIIKDSVLYFSGDAKFRSKIGLSPSRAKQILGSYDSENKVLTIIKYNKPKGVNDYVNSLWKIQKEPFKGDVVNAYNDGPSEPGAKQLGQFYELETSSPALALKAGESRTHTQLTFHFEGAEEILDALARQLLGVSLEEITDSI